LQRETLHISDDTGRIAMLETRTAGTPAPIDSGAIFLMNTGKGIYAVNFIIDDPSSVIIFYKVIESEKIKVPVANLKPSSDAIKFIRFLMQAQEMLINAKVKPIPPPLYPIFRRFPVIVIPGILDIIMGNEPKLKS